MYRWFEKYKRFLGAFFLLWLFLWTAGKFGFGFGVEPFFLFKLVFLLGAVWVVGEIWINWDKIHPALKAFWAKQKSEFFSRTKATQAEIVSFSPKILGGKAGGLVVLPLAVTSGVFRGFGGIVKGFFQVLFSKEGVLFLGALGILVDIFVFSFTSDLIILFLVGLWIWSIRSYRFEGRVSVAAALVFLVTCPFLLILEKDLIAEKTAVWAYMFLVVGVGQMFVENIKCGERG